MHVQVQVHMHSANKCKYKCAHPRALLLPPTSRSCGEAMDCTYLCYAAGKALQNKQHTSEAARAARAYLGHVAGDVAGCHENAVPRGLAKAHRIQPTAKGEGVTRGLRIGAI